VLLEYGVVGVGVGARVRLESLLVHLGAGKMGLRTTKDSATTSMQVESRKRRFRSECIIVTVLLRFGKLVVVSIGIA
jgi:hypothetical protein